MNDKGDFLAGLIVGGILGLAAGLLFAPAPGDETRRVLRERADDTLGGVRGGIDRVRDSASRARDSLGRLGDTVREYLPAHDEAAADPEVHPGA